MDRTGTKAAAVTAVSVEVASAEPPEFKTVNCDRPFVYAIVDVKTMAPIFIGTVNESWDNSLEDAKMKTFTNKYIKVISGVMTAVLLLGGCAGKTPSGKPLTDDLSIKAEIDLGEVKKAEYDSALMDSEYKRYCFDSFKPDH